MRESGAPVSHAVSRFVILGMAAPRPWNRGGFSEAWRVSEDEVWRVVVVFHARCSGPHGASGFVTRTPVQRGFALRNVSDYNHTLSLTVILSRLPAKDLGGPQNRHR